MAEKRSAGGDRLSKVVPDLIRYTDEILYADLWERPNLSKRDRALVTITAIATQYRPELLAGHIRRGLNNGLTIDEIGEAFTQIAFYSDWPGAVVAAGKLLEVANAIEAEQEAAEKAAAEKA
jgi:4-carboxymuconolactone decarboxylase